VSCGNQSEYLLYKPNNYSLLVSTYSGVGVSDKYNDNDGKYAGRSKSRIAGLADSERFELTPNNFLVLIQSLG
jgi:hypothetical protein